MADGSKRRKCFSTDEVLQFLLGSAEEDETLHDDSEHLSEDSEDDSRDSAVTDTETVADLCRARDDFEVPSFPDRLRSSKMEAEVDSDADNTAEDETFAESTADCLEADISLIQHNGMLCDSSDADKATAEPDVNDSLDDGDMGESTSIKESDIHASEEGDSGGEDRDASYIEPSGIEDADAGEEEESRAVDTPEEESRSEDTSEEESGSEDTSDEESEDVRVVVRGRGGRGRGSRGRGGRGRGGRGKGVRGRGVHGSVGRGRGGRGRGGRGRQQGRKVPKRSIPITTTDTKFEKPGDFCPMREPGPHLPQHIYAPNVTGLDIFLLFCNETVLERLVTATLAYAEMKKHSKWSTYLRFTAHLLTNEEMMCFIGCFLLMSINSVRSYRQAWDKNSSQFMIRLLQLMSRNRFEAIGSFLHVVTPTEEAQLADHPLKKILPLHNYIKNKCMELYQPLKEISIDERIVKSKARTHFRQYIKNKPTKWGFKYWVISDPTGYTLDFNIYQGARTVGSGRGVAYDAVMELVQPYRFQGYELYCDNFYSSPSLFADLYNDGIFATGTLRTDRKGVPGRIKKLKMALNRSDVSRGTGYYWRKKGSRIVYCGWRDSKCVMVMSCAHPGHAEGTVRRKVKGAGGTVMLDVKIPIMIKRYNAFMGGVDKSDQLISYHHILRQTIRYWKTPLYHLLEIMVTNAFILHNWLRMECGERRETESRFRDQLVLQIIAKYGSSNVSQSLQSADTTIRHGSTILSQDERHLCAWCKVHRTNRQCCDCDCQPMLCQVLGRDCHAEWHLPSSKEWRRKWEKRKKRIRSTSQETVTPAAKRKAGRPPGSQNVKKRRGRYRNV